LTENGVVVDAMWFRARSVISTTVVPQDPRSRICAGSISQATARNHHRAAPTTTTRGLASSSTGMALVPMANSVDSRTKNSPMKHGDCYSRCPSDTASSSALISDAWLLLLQSNLHRNLDFSLQNVFSLVYFLFWFLSF